MALELFRHGSLVTRSFFSLLQSTRMLLCVGICNRMRMAPASSIRIVFGLFCSRGWCTTTPPSHRVLHSRQFGSLATPPASLHVLLVLLLLPPLGSRASRRRSALCCPPCP